MALTRLLALTLTLSTLFPVSPAAASHEFFVQVRAGVASHGLGEVGMDVVAPDGFVTDRFSGVRGVGGSAFHDLAVDAGLAGALLTGARLDERWWLGIGLERLDIRDRSQGFLGGSSGSLDFSAWSLVAHVGREIRGSWKRARLVPSVELGVLIPGGDAVDLGYREGTWSERAVPTASAILGLDRQLAHDAILAVELGYRIARSEGTGATGRMSVDLDYSGVFVRFGIRLFR